MDSIDGLCRTPIFCGSWAKYTYALSSDVDTFERWGGVGGVLDLLA
jgi:hypothetical protein